MRILKLLPILGFLCGVFARADDLPPSAGKRKIAAAISTPTPTPFFVDVDATAKGLGDRVAAFDPNSENAEGQLKDMVKLAQKLTVFLNFQMESRRTGKGLSLVCAHSF